MTRFKRDAGHVRVDQNARAIVDDREGESV